MYIIPAIDLLDGEVVRLRQGDFDQARHYAVTGLQLARNYAAAGAKWLHVVDLAASRDGSSGQPEILLRLLKSAPHRQRERAPFHQVPPIETKFSQWPAPVDQYAYRGLQPVCPSPA